MKASLLNWIGDADALRHIDQFEVRQVPLAYDYQRTRKDDLYISLVGELFERLQEGYGQATDWARLGNALAQFAAADRANELRSVGINQGDAALFSATAFYVGGFPASAYVTMRSSVGQLEGDHNRACYDFLARPRQANSGVVRDLIRALLDADTEEMVRIQSRVSEMKAAALEVGPDEWIPLRLLEILLARFRATNIRAILPEGNSGFWTPLIGSLVNRGVWDLFPSQIEAIQRGLLTRGETFSLQMPTGAGKTALCEILLYSHLKRNLDAAAVLLVPYRSLAAELRYSVVRRLNAMGISARCAYGGTVPSGDEIQSATETRALVATPETLSGLLSANAAFAGRISLVICDEGHLLDAPSRGIGLELLLARMRTISAGNQRFVFVSAIVPNIEEINLWLGGTDDSVVRSDYRPAVAEFAVLRSSGDVRSSPLDLEMHPQEAEPIRYKIDGFLQREDFQFQNPETQRLNTYAFSSLKTRAIAAARKALPMGATAVFAANKRGNQGAIGLAEELLNQLDRDLNLPNPASFADHEAIDVVTEYLENEYGEMWIGARALKMGAVLHHGDIPQESREVVEKLLRDRKIALVICTSTLAEGVNLPIRTLVLYSVQRVGQEGARTDLLTRDIKNLVGRAGRAGSNTKGLVICTNPEQWPLIAAVAQQAAGEPVLGALRVLVQRLQAQLTSRNLVLSNELLERSVVVHSLIDGIDATLIDLATLEIGEEALLQLATDLADQTFASRQTDDASKHFLRDVFRLRAQRVSELQSSGRLLWIKETGSRARMLQPVETDLLTKRPRWDDVLDPVDSGLVNLVFDWAWSQLELRQAVREAYRIGTEGDPNAVRESFFLAVRLWLAGATFRDISEGASIPMDDLLGVHARAITFALQTIVEQGLALLGKVLSSQGQEISPAVLKLSEHLRFGVATPAGCALAAGGIRHRRAFVTLGDAPELRDLRIVDRFDVFSIAMRLVESAHEDWRARLGSLVFENTLRDLSAVVNLNS